MTIITKDNKLIVISQTLPDFSKEENNKRRIIKINLYDKNN